MKALCLKEPYASMVLRREKTIETRTWNTKYRGKVLFCASKNPKSEISGKAFAIVEIVDCIPMRKEHEKDACVKVYPKAKAWILKNIKPIEPFEVKGQLNLFEVDYDES